MTEHREIAISFLKLAASGKARDAYTRYVGPDFRHHNPFFRGDCESLMLAMEENANSIVISITQVMISKY